MRLVIDIAGERGGSGKHQSSGEENVLQCHLSFGSGIDFISTGRYSRLRYRPLDGGS